MRTTGKYIGLLSAAMMMTSVLLTSCKSDDDNYYEAASSVSEIAGSWIAAYNSVWWFTPTDTAHYKYNDSNTAIKITAKTGNEGTITFYDYDSEEEKWEPGEENPFTLKNSKMYITYSDGTKDTIKVESIGQKSSERKNEKRGTVETIVLDQGSIASDENYDINYISYEKVDNMDEWVPGYDMDDFYNDCAGYVDLANSKDDKEIGAWVLTTIYEYDIETEEYTDISDEEYGDKGYFEILFHKDTMTLEYSAYGANQYSTTKTVSSFEIEDNMLKHKAPYTESGSSESEPTAIISELFKAFTSGKGCEIAGFDTYYDEDYYDAAAISFCLYLEKDDVVYQYFFDWWSDSSIKSGDLQNLLKKTTGIHKKRNK